MRWLDGRCLVGAPSETLPEGFPDITFLPRTGIRALFKAAEHAARDSGFALWLNDDEQIVPTQLPMPAPITEDLTELGLRGVWVTIDRSGALRTEPRFVSSTFQFPLWSRYSLCGVGQADTDRIFIASGFRIDQTREPCPPGHLRLNVGCGSRTFSRWTNIDYDSECRPDILLDLSKDKLPFDAASVEAVYSSHMVDHLTYREGKAFLEDCLRVMKPGAPLRVTACDMEVFARAYFSGTLGKFDYFQPEEFRNAATQGTKLGILACGNASDRGFYSGHKMLYMPESLGELLAAVGFTNVHVCAQDERAAAFDDVDDIFPDSRAILEGTRP